MNIFSLQILFFIAVLITIPSFAHFKKVYVTSSRDTVAINLCWDGISLKVENKTVCQSQDINKIPTIYRQLYFLPIPINDASYELLLTIPGVGPSIAQRIVEFRSLKGTILELDELRQVEGIGIKKLITIKKHTIIKE